MIMSSTTLLQKLRELSAVDCDTLDSEGESLLKATKKWSTSSGQRCRSLSGDAPAGSLQGPRSDSTTVTNQWLARLVQARPSTNLSAVAKKLGPFVDCTSNQVRDSPFDASSALGTGTV